MSKTWFQYDHPLPEVPNAPVPSQANYSPTNVAWMIELFANTLGYTKEEVKFRYENNTPSVAADDIEVAHPGDKDYLPAASQPRPKSAALRRYELYAKNSAILREYEEKSPAGIEYFQDL